MLTVTQNIVGFTQLVKFLCTFWFFVAAWMKLE